MVQQRDKWGLSLSLSFPGSSNHHHKLTNNNNQTAHVSSPLELNLVPSATSNPLPENTTQKSHSSEENAKLKKEVQELRAFKLSPQFSIPPTTLTICPSCEHFSKSSSAPTLSVCPSSTHSKQPQVHAMSASTIDSISTCAPNVD
ncbi:hypothetical protein ACET3Z_004826 [Daucus carota]